MLHVEILGRLGADAEKTDDYIVFNVAHNQKVQGVETTTWIKCFYHYTGTKFYEFLLKGTRVFVRGPLSTRIYMKDGEPQVGLSCSVHVLELAGDRKEPW